jgi:hypothetical protein
MDRARGLGLHTKDNWKKQQGAMLVARATAECCRLVAADAILGIPYAAEELDDGSTAAPEQPKRTAQRRTVRAKASVERLTAPEPDLPEAADDPLLPDEDERPALPAAPTVEGPSDAQTRKLAAMFAKAGIAREDREKRLRISSQLVNRELSSWNDMTKQDAHDLIDTLEDLEKQGPLGQMIEELLSAAAPADDDSPYLPDDPDLTAHERGEA